MSVRLFLILESLKAYFQEPVIFQIVFVDQDVFYHEMVSVFDQCILLVLNNKAILHPLWCNPVSVSSEFSTLFSHMNKG